MPAEKFSLSHVRRLDDLDAARLKYGPSGISHYVDQLIRRIESGGAWHDSWGNFDNQSPRYVQAKHYWCLGIGQALGYRTFEEYFHTVPEVPPHLAEAYGYLVLDESRAGLRTLCAFADVGIEERCDLRFRPTDPETAVPSADAAHWIRVRGVRLNKDAHVRGVREGLLAGRTCPVSAAQAICFVIQHGWNFGDVIRNEPERRGSLMHALGSVCAAPTDFHAMMRMRSGVVELLSSGTTVLHENDVVLSFIA